MSPLQRFLLSSALAVAAACSLAQSRVVGATLAVGDKAPPLVVGDWVKGSPVSALRRGRIYVVEFWATWCGPCKQSIPRLTALHHEFGNSVTFVGVSVWENDWSGVAPFVQNEGSQMEYSVATDRVASPEDHTGFMATFWMSAAKRNTIPTAFIIDRDGKIAWIGHPMQLEQPLHWIVAQKWHGKADADPAPARAPQQPQQTAQSKLQLAARKLAEDMKNNNSAAALNDLDRMQAIDPASHDMVWDAKLRIYLKTNNKQGFYAVATKIVDEAGKDPNLAGNSLLATSMNDVSWAIVDPNTVLQPRNLALAMKAADLAVQASKGTQAGMIDTLAWCYYWKGDKAKAVDLETQAISKVGPDDSVDDFKKSLDTFNKS